MGFILGRVARGECFVRVELLVPGSCVHFSVKLVCGRVSGATAVALTVIPDSDRNCSRL
jgi:hypothetical protein